MKDSCQGFSKNDLEGIKDLTIGNPSLVLFCTSKDQMTPNYLPSDVPGRRALFHHGSIGAHIEDVPQIPKFRLVWEKLATRFLPVVERFEKRKGEHFRCRPVRHCVAYHHWLP